jgi:hypothetical protein
VIAGAPPGLGPAAVDPAAAGRAALDRPAAAGPAALDPAAAGRAAVDPAAAAGPAAVDRPAAAGPAAIDPGTRADATADHPEGDAPEASGADALPLTAGRAWAVGAGGLLIAALGAVALAVSAGGDGDRPPPREPADSQLFAGTPRAAGHENAVRDALDNARLPEDEAIVDPSTVELPPPPVEEPPADEPPARTGPRPPRPSDQPPAEPAMEEVADPPPEPPSGEGFLRIGRGSAGQERVEVDGATRGFTPTVLRLAAGSHRIVIRDAATGGVLSEATVDVGPHHTRVSPLVLPR